MINKKRNWLSRARKIFAKLSRSKRSVRALRAQEARWKLPAQKIAEVRAHFDAKYYLFSNPDVAADGGDPFEHYMDHGWREGRNPSEVFSTNYYLETNPEIKNAGLNPLQHYVLAGQFELRESRPHHLRRLLTHKPLVSVIVPNYNHARFLENRFKSILEQTYQKIELIVLDDCSLDNSIEVIDRCLADVKFPVFKIYNEANSGNVFEQWRKGFEIASGELIWICESDDFAERDFLERLVPHFADLAVMVAFGRIQFADANGAFQPGMDQFRERAESGIWSGVSARPAAEWFAKAFSTFNVIANVGGCLIKNQAVPQHVWATARTYKIAGDWYLYSKLSNGGKIVFDPQAVSYFRQHPENTSASNFKQLYYFEEHARIIVNNCSIWNIPTETQRRFAEQVQAQWDRLGMNLQYGTCESHFPDIFRYDKKRTNRHIVVASLGFIAGGGELFPIYLSNGLVEAGVTTSILAHNVSEINEDMLGRLDRRVAVYDVGGARKKGLPEFLEDAGVSLINSHSINIDDVFFRKDNDVHDFPYVVTLHGSHDVFAGDIGSLMYRMLKGVKHWVYTADKNLGILSGIPLRRSSLSKLPNAMPRDPRESPYDRERLGIAQDAVVFTLVARGIERKGWRASLEAFQRLREREPECSAHLILVGSGPRADEMKSIFGDRKDVSFLGYQSEINGLYRLSDCAIIPSRFAGESYPLCMIQAVQERLAIIATDIAEIPNMLAVDDMSAGRLVPALRDTNSFIEELSEAMHEMLDTETRQKYRARTEKLGVKFDMSELAQKYLMIFDKVIESTD